MSASPSAHPARSPRPILALLLALLATVAGALAPASSAAAGAIFVTPSEIDFGVIFGGNRSEVDVTIVNVSDAPVQIIEVGVTQDTPFGFFTPGGTFPSLEPGEAFTFKAIYLPPAAVGAGTQDESILRIDVDAPDSAIDVPLSGTRGPVTPPPVTTISVDKPSVDYGYQRPGPHPCPVTVTNTGNQTVFFGEVSVGDGSGPGPDARLAGDPVWSVEGSNAPLEPGETRVFTVIFDAAENISYASTLSIYSTADGSPLQIPLKGKGQVGKLQASASALAFGNVSAGSKLSKTITVKNVGTFAATFKAAIAGAGAGKYTVSGSTAPLAINEIRTLTVTFAPTARGSLSASLVLDGNAFNTPVSVPLSGKGIGPVASLSASSIAFGSVVRGRSLAKTITVKNTGETSLTFAAPTISGTDAARFTISGATTALAVGASRTFTVTFRPATKRGAHTASLKFNTNSVPAPGAVALSGTGT